MLDVLSKRLFAAYGPSAPVINGTPAFAGLRFDRGLVEAYGGLDFSAGFSRGSAGTFIDAAGNIQTAGVNVPRLQSASGNRTALLMEAGRTRLNPYVSIRSAWVGLSSVTVTNLAESVFGQFAGLRVAANDANWNRVTTTASVVSGTAYAVKFMYRAGSSGRVRFVLRNNSAATESTAAGPVGGTLALTSVAGAISILRDTALAGGLRETVLLFTPNFTGAFQLGIGPDTVTAGQTIDAFAWQVEAGTSDTAWILGDNNASVTRSPDLANIALPASAQTAMAAGYWVAAQGAVISGVSGPFDHIFRLDTGIADHGHILVRDQAAGTLLAAQNDANTQQASLSFANALGARSNMAVRFALNDFAVVWPNGSSGTDLVAAYRSPSVLRIAANDTAGNNKPASLLIERIDLFPPTVSVADMAAYRSAMP